MTAVLALRLPPAAGSPLVVLDEEDGWLGNQATLMIAPWGVYTDDRTAASWHLDAWIASSWQALGR